MKSASFFSALLLLLIFSACSPAARQEELNVNPGLVLEDFNTWWNYTYDNINLSENYTALDTNARQVSKSIFLESLSSGAYTAFRLKTSDSSVKYQLYHFGPSVDKDITATIKQIGEDGLRKYKMEGTTLPGFNFRDLKGNVYNKETTEGKIVLLKCWFINCHACVKEMPALNELVKKFQKRQDVVFISMAYDSKEQLSRFLSKTTFNYAVIPVDEKYMSEKLNVGSYPTHFIINRNGAIAKVVNNYHDLITCLDRELAK